MNHRTQIPALALLGLTFTACTGDEPPAIIGEWGAIQLDGEKLPYVYSDGPYRVVSGLSMTVEGDLAGHMEIYDDVDLGDYGHHTEYGTDLVVDELGASRYRIELAYDLLGEGNPYYNDADGGSEEPIGEGDALRVGGLAAPIPPSLAPAGAAFTCTLDQDTLSCETEGATSIIFKRKAADSD